MTRKLPIGIQSFEKLRADGFVYVDKTAYVHALAQAGVPVFLGRPRRFGKSLLVSTFKAYFEGKRELFEGLEIERLEGDGPDAWTARPVFHLDFNGQDYTTDVLESALSAQLGRWERAWGLDGSTLLLGDRFRNVLGAAHRESGQRAAVLVDEYDKPLLESMHDPELEEKNRGTLKGFYSVLKESDEHLQFAFLTGVTKFSKVSIFSDLNQLSDISFERDFAGICGITEDELKRAFAPELDELADELDMRPDECLDALRGMYDGYCFHPDGPDAPAQENDGGHSARARRVYNPFSLLNALQKKRLSSWWFATGTPTFLVRRMKESGLDPRRLTDGTIYATDRRLSDYRADDPDPIPLLYQTGYLTVKGKDDRSGRYVLGVPNGEVEWGLVDGLLPVWAPGYSEMRGTDVLSLLDHVDSGNTDGMRDVIAALFASIPYTQADDPFENYFQAVLWLVFTLLGRYAATEVHQANGRVDCVVEVAEHVYIIEFKRKGSADEALAQIAENGYAAPYAADSRKLHLIGCAFDEKTRQLNDWKAE